MHRLKWLVAGALGMALAASPAFAQGGASTTTLAGVVVDKDGGVVPGATVTVKNNATGTSLNTVTNAQGAYSFPAIETGTYTVTIALQGFKTAVVNDVRVLAATPANLRTVLEIGALTETVEVKGGTELVRTETPTVSATVTTELINNLPVSSRSALNYLVFLPGVETNGNSTRGSTISGLPQNTINITIDGVSNGNNLQSGDGFFSLVTPRLDAVEEVTLTTATAGADSSSQGATQIRFVTRSGTNTYESSVYEYFRHSSLNANRFFDRLAGLPRRRETVHQYGGRTGGPIMLPGFDGRGKAFFFANQEESWQPNEVRRTRTVLGESAMLGNFTYNLNSPRTVNVLALAAANNQLATQDPVVQALLQSIRSAVQTTGTLTTNTTSPNTQSYNWLSPTGSIRHNTTARVDLNVTTRNRLSGSYYIQRFRDDPDTLNTADPVFPGFPLKGHQASYRTTGSITFRSTLGPNLVNEVLSGWQSSPVDFFADISADRFSNQGGFSLGLNAFQSLSNVTPGNFGNAPEWRNTKNWNIDNTLNWLKGNHSLRFGASFLRIDNKIDDWNVVPSISFGVNTTNDPANAMFNTTNFPTASTGDLNSARALYALLTGRVTQIGATARLNEAGNEYIYNGHIIQTERMDDFGFYATDTWRMRPNLTLTYGLRYQLQLPMVPTNGTFTTSTVEDLCGPSGLGNGIGGRQCNLFNPGVLNNPTQIPTYLKYEPGNKGYNTDKNNFAPNIGIAWRPNVQEGWLSRLLGDPEMATVTAGYTRSFNRERIDRFLSVFGNNPGASRPATRGTGATQFPLVLPGEPWPILLRETSRLGPPPFDPNPSFPITASFAAGNDVRVFDPNIEVPYTNSWSFGLQRSVGRDTAVEVRYVGNKNIGPWTTENWNVENVIETGFLEEFKVAQANLRANVLAGRGGSFAYFGPGTGTSPLPIFLTHFTGLPSSAAGNPANYTTAAFANAAQFTNSTWVDRLDYIFPDPAGIAANLWTGNSGVWRANMLAGGLPSSFWVMNPLVDDAVVTRNRGGSKYHSIQIDVRRRLAQGFTVQGSYTWARAYVLSNPQNLQGGNNAPVELHRDLINRRDDNVPHAFKAIWVWDIPVGRGKRFGTDMNPWLDGVLGGWTFSGSGRVQLPLFRVTNARLVGMSHAEAQKLFKEARIITDPLTGAITIWDMPQEVIDNTRRAYNTDPTSPTLYPAGEEPTGRYFAPAGGPDCMALFAKDCADDLFFTGAWWAEFDFKMVKRFPFGQRRSFQVDMELFNAFNAINFNYQMNPGSGSNIFRIQNNGSGPRTGQVAVRFNF